MSARHDIVTGVSFAMRSQGRVSVWVSENASDVITAFLKELREVVKITAPCRFFNNSGNTIIELV